MRNLKLDVLKIQKLAYNEETIIRCIDIQNKRFLLTSNGRLLSFLNGEGETIVSNIGRTIDWVVVENIIYIGTGQTFQCYNVETGQISVIEVSGDFVAHEWNPSQERIALVDKRGILKIAFLDPHNCLCGFTEEYHLDSHEDSPFINIGWGSQNTQFRGKEGKFSEIITENEDFTATQNNLPHIAWRADGEMFAVSFVQNEQRKFKVFSCEGAFLYENEYKAGLQAELTWRPDGSVIATETRKEKSHHISFFERNGLFLYDLNLPTNQNVKKIRWNSSGDILMIWQESTDGSEISLWTRSNGKWYLKQSLIFKENNSVSYVGWSKKFLEVISGGKMLKYSWKWVTDVSGKPVGTQQNKDDIGAIVVIDGNDLLVTATSRQIIPPPFCSYNIHFEKPINHVTFGYMRNTLTVILNDCTVKLFDITETDYKETFSGKINDSSMLLPLAYNNFIYNDDDCILYWAENVVQEESRLRYGEMNFSSNEIKLVGELCFESMKNFSNLLCMYTSDENKYHLAVSNGLRVLLCPLPRELNIDSKLMLIEDEVKIEGGHYSVFYIFGCYFVIYLHNQRLYCNNKRIANNITSFLLSHNYILLTTTDDELMCVKLSEKGLKNLQACNLHTFYKRDIESGGVLICTVPRTRKIVLQIPRGNIEIINPRVLSIEEIDRLLDEKRHLEAFKIMRTDRINPNILYDLQPIRFLRDINDLIKNLNNCEYLDLILLQLEDSNVSEQIYRNCFQDPLPIQDHDKKNTVLAKFIEEMKTIDVNFYLQSIITAYVCKGTDEDLEQALTELFCAKTREDGGSALRVPVDDVLEHMIIISSVEKLYDVALGMDKLDLLMWVASKSHINPQEYIPFLSNLCDMEQNYRNYKINNHLKRFEKAFSFLIKCDNVLEELTELITKNKLYVLIVKYLDPSNQWYKNLFLLYGNYLHTERRYKESGLIYMQINAYEIAVDYFVQGCCMKEALTAYYQLGQKVNVNERFVDLAAQLLTKKRYEDASLIYETVLNDYENSISILIEGCLWSQAINLALKNNRHDIVEAEIKLAIVKYAQDLCTNLNAYRNEILLLRTRLETIRNEKIEMLQHHAGTVNENLATENNDNEDRQHSFDLESVASTNYSRVTGRSHRSNSSQMTSASTKRRRKLEKKITEIKEGSTFENIAIIRRLHILITDVQNQAQSVSDTCLHLTLCQEQYAKVKELHTLYNELMVLVDLSKCIIWPKEMITPSNHNTIASQVYRFNLDELDNLYRLPPPDLNINWKLEFFIN